MCHGFVTEDVERHLIARQESAEGIVVRGVGRAREAPQAERRGKRIGPTGNGGRRPERSTGASRNRNS